MNAIIDLNKQNEFLKSQNANYSILKDTVSIKTASEGAKHYGISLNECTPTLILKIGKTYYAAIICGNTRISFKKLKQIFDTQDVRLADSGTVQKLTGAKVGYVSLINEDIPTLMDNAVLKNENCYGGCGILNVTLRIHTSDLVRITNAQILDFTDPHL